LLTDGNYYFGGGLNSGGLFIGYKQERDYTNWGRYLGIFNATVTFADRGSGAGPGMEVFGVHPPIDSSEYNRYQTTLEIGAGAKVTIPWNRWLSVGSNQSYAKLILSGELTINRYGQFYIGYGDYCTGEFYMNGGLLTLHEPIRHQYGLYSSGSAGCDCTRFFWKGGTIRLGKNLDSSTLFASQGTPLRSFCQIKGDDCVLDLGDYSKTAVSNTPANVEHAQWFGTGTLRVKGGKTCKTLVMNTFPNDVKLCLENGAKVVVPDGAKVYDAAKCPTAWWAPTSGDWKKSTDAWLATGDVHLAELQLADDTYCCVSNRIAGQTLAVGTIRALTNGVFGVASAPLAAVGATSFANVAFDTGAIWAIGATTLTVPGTLSFGEMVKAKMDVVPASNVLAEAGTALKGNPTVVKAGARPVRCVFDAVKKQVIRTFLGLQLLVR